MPRIDDIEDTPNPNAKKFILREPLTWGTARSYENAEQAKDDPAPVTGEVHRGHDAASDTGRG